MLMMGLSAIVAYIFGRVAWQSAPRGWRWVRLGWALIEPHARTPEGRANVEGRRAISEGGNFIVAGLGWLFISAVSVVMMLFFAWQTLLFSGLF
jgi:hypothetical protein